MTDEQAQALAAATKRVLAERKWSINKASIELGIDRQSVTRLANGRPPRVEVVEKFARRLGEDVNRWRTLCGYPAVWDMRSDLIEALHLRAGYEDLELLPVLNPDDFESVATPDDVDRVTEKVIGQMLDHVAEGGCRYLYQGPLKQPVPVLANALARRVLAHPEELSDVEQLPELSALTIAGMAGTEEIPPSTVNVIDQILRELIILAQPESGVSTPLTETTLHEAGHAADK